MQQLSQDLQQQQLQRFYREELKELAQTRDTLRAQYRPDESNSDSDYDSRSDQEDDDDVPVGAADMETHIPESNVGYKLLLKMGWKAGTGLGQNATGRTAPIPIGLKQDTLGIGKQELVVLYNESTTAKRRTLEVERQAEETEEDRIKREEHVQKKMAVQAELESVKSAFYCALCDKQYERIADYEAHLSSYDHNHKKRFKEMKETSRAGAASATNKAKEKERKREERELAKMQEAALKRAGGAQPSVNNSINSNLIGASTSQQAQSDAPSTTGSSVLSGFQPVKLGGFQPVKSSGFQPIKLDDKPLGTSDGANQGSSASTTTGSTVTSGFQPVKLGGFQPVKVGSGFQPVKVSSGFQPVKVSGFQQVEEDESEAESSASAKASISSGPDSTPTPSGFQTVKLGGFKPMKIGSFQLKKPGNK
ncbi:G patch domain-containing protein 8 [Mortierella sp. AD094]|nr:G patch domain-containing protein 8 [Mortierella sp. AD094]